MEARCDIASHVFIGQNAVGLGSDRECVRAGRRIDHAVGSASDAIDGGIRRSAKSDQVGGHYSSSGIADERCFGEVIQNLTHRRKGAQNDVITGRRLLQRGAIRKMNDELIQPVLGTHP